MSTLWLLKKLPLERRTQAKTWSADPWAYSVKRNHELVVRADTEFQARQVAEEVAGMESAKEQVWMNPHLTSCTMIPWQGLPEVICGNLKDMKHKNPARKKKPDNDGYVPDKNTTKYF
jgi:hypothetical protein